MNRLPAVLLLFALALLPGCRRGGGATAASPAPTFPKAPVVLVSIDTLRSDHLPFYGYKGVATPSLSEFRKDAVLFTRAFTHVPLTLPAHLSLFTGVLPAVHGVHDNLGYRLKPDVPTLAELLRKAGYRTGGAISAVVLNSGTGAGRGFDFFEDSLEPTGTAQAQSRVQRTGPETAALLEGWLGKPSDAPPFAFLHLYEPHTPYEPPEPFRSRHLDNLYDGEIEAADAVVGRFFAFLREKGLYDRSLVIVLSDHGESLGEHGEDEHGVFLYRNVLQVPLLVKLPKGAAGFPFAGTALDTPVALIDVFATVGRALALPGFPEHPGTVSLIDLAAGAPAPERRLYAETFFPRVRFGWSDLFSLTDGRWQYIEAPRPEFYEMEKDPGETANLIGEKPGPFRSMKIDLEKRKAAFVTPSAVDEEEKKKLQALGYLSSGATAGPGPLPDPKDEIGLIRTLNEAMGHVRAGEPGRALPVFKALLGQNPRMTDVWELYSEALKEADRLPEALAARKKMVELSPPEATHALLAVANLCLELGRVDEAIQNAQLARERGDLATDEVLARAWYTKKDLPAAEAAARRAMEYGRTRKRAHLIMARIQVQKGSLANALELVDQAAVLYRSEGVPEGFHLLRGDILARMDRLPEAEVEMREEIRLHPRAVPPRISLALVLASRGRMAEARRMVVETAAAIPRLDAFVKGAAALDYFGDRAEAAALRRRGHALYPDDPRLKSGS